MPIKRWAFEAAAIAVAVAMLGFFISRTVYVHGNAMPSGQPFFGDYMAFWSAGRAALDGHAHEIHERTMLWQVQQAIAPDVKFFAPWNSPPTFLMIVCVLALLPYPVSAVFFLVSTLVLFGFAIRRFLPDARALILPFTSPTVLYQTATVQAGMLIAGVNGLAIRWLDKRPHLAGALIGFLAIKPHIALLWPLFLALSGRWRVFMSAAVAALTFVVMAGLMFGFDTYLNWFESLNYSQRLISEQRITTPAYASLYANLLGLDAPQALAIGLHAVSAVAGIIVACVVFRKGDVALGGAALCAATLLVSPYLFFYDFTTLLVGAALLGAPRSSLDYAAAIFAWGAALSVALGQYISLPICPLAAWLVLVTAFTRVKSAAPLLAPAPQP
ncbi:MAG: glycosyltransferase family 87 protein [Terricaulis sp.]